MGTHTPRRDVPRGAEPKMIHESFLAGAIEYIEACCDDLEGAQYRGTLGELADKATDVCKHQGWDRGWSNGGCHLHLEVSEFIEALRGKGAHTPTEEAADVLFVILSMCRANGIDLEEVRQYFHRRCDGLLGV